MVGLLCIVTCMVCMHVFQVHMYNVRKAHQSLSLVVFKTLTVDRDANHAHDWGGVGGASIVQRIANIDGAGGDDGVDWDPAGRSVLGR